jgi:hypothetical protein
MPHKPLTIIPRDRAAPLSDVPGRTKRLRAVPGRLGFEHWTLRCAECGLIHEVQVPAAPTAPEAPASADLRPR